MDQADFETAGLRKRTRTPHEIESEPVVTHISKPMAMGIALDTFKERVKSFTPCAKFENDYIDTVDAECMVSGFSGPVTMLGNIETDSFKFFIEDGRLVARHVTLQKPKDNTRWLVGAAWFTMLVLLCMFVAFNIEGYKRLLA